MWGRRWRKPLPHSQNLGVQGQRKPHAPSWQSRCSRAPPQDSQTVASGGLNPVGKTWSLGAVNTQLVSSQPRFGLTPSLWTQSC